MCSLQSKLHGSDFLDYFISLLVCFYALHPLMFIEGPGTSESINGTDEAVFGSG